MSVRLTKWPNNAPEPAAVSSHRSHVAKADGAGIPRQVGIPAAGRRWLSFVQRGIKVAGLFQRHKEAWTGTEVGSQNEENPILDLMNGMMNALRTIPI